MNPEDQLSIVRFLQQIHPISDELAQHVAKLCEQVSFERKTILTREGETERYLYFVIEGIQRSYYIKDGREHVIAFTYPPSFSGIPESFITQTPSLYFLETITPSTLFRLPYHQLAQLLDEHREIERLMRIATQQVLAGVIHRHYELMAFSMEERFRVFIQRSPHLLGMVPHKHLASYLRMDATNFSKLLATVRL